MFATTPKTQSLLIVPFGTIRKEVLVFLQNELIRTFGFDVRIAREEHIPQYAFDPKRRQYQSTKILEWLKNIPVMDTRFLGIVDLDLYVPELNFVFGEADVAHGVCVISLVRLRQEFYGLPKNEKQFLERALKEAVHEIGHTYRLGHCGDTRCIMHFSNSLQDTDIKGPDFCSRCKLKLR
ncbi:MAG TPA: archaemetzincin family Zn-dependent metalloprotease [Candidatus Wunengus sp. YC61]|uniref:archaemetzincin family Zn-dependent metalloprotease n=1 Tax=Candidatus Wunengus sp. YC61 TaxID=3367698 RepID=UPI0040251FDC